MSSKTPPRTPPAVVFHVGDVIRKLRDGAGLTGAELCRLADIHTETLSRIENGDTSRTDTLGKVAAALGVSVPQVYAWASSGLSDDERELLAAWRKTTADQRLLLRGLLREFSSTDRG